MASPPHSRCRNTTANTSRATVAIEMTYVPSDPGVTFCRCAIILNVSNTSLTSALHSRSLAISGLLPSSSPTRNAVRFSSSHSAYEPRPMCRVIASIASAWRSDSWRMSSLTSLMPKL